MVSEPDFALPARTVASKLKLGLQMNSKPERLRSRVSRRTDMNRRCFHKPLLLLLFFTRGFVLPADAQQPVAAKRELPDKVHSNLWMQTSAEFRALCLQTFNQALKEIRREVEAAPHQEGRPLGADGHLMAVVADLDETILDNSRFQTELVFQNKEYSEALWNRWVENNAKDVELVPGAARFIAEVERLKVVMVYISNRPEKKRALTIQALAHNGVNTAGLEIASELRLLLKTESSSKEARHKAVHEKYHIIAYVGDNLADFPGDFGPTVESRYQRADEFEQLWGSRWFVLPNPIYGDWERVLGAERASHLKRARDRRFIEER
jgi:5'-nucleotidase (lipoprotein e(P4) family)